MIAVKKFVSVITVISLLAAGQAMALDFGGLVKSIGGKVATDKAVEEAGDALSGEDTAEAGTPDVTADELAAAAPVVNAPLDVVLEPVRGSADIFAKRPKIAIAGYNIGAFQTSSISGSTSRGQGASVNMKMALAGVDEAMLQRIADAAHADMVVRLQAAGIDVIDAPVLFATPEAKEIKRSDKPMKDGKMDGRASKDLLVVGPTSVGVVSSFGLIPKGFNGNVGDQASAALDAIVIYPNLALDFVWTGGGGKSMLNSKVSVEGGARFAVDSTTNIFAVYSKDGRFVDGSVTFGPGEDVGVDDVFATVSQADSSNNSASVGISNALGVGMSSRKGSSYTVAADPARYEMLALNAAQGVNEAFVQLIKAAK